ncbi:hypothetical protein BDR04DRAFT_1094172 [Suillus decipiens]|nr:hypothetical protein BDR04DRAFT_1094172 [Suillus decipiens]
MMSTTETKDTSFKTVFLINLVMYNQLGRRKNVNKLKEANLTIAPSAEDYVTILHAVLATRAQEMKRLMTTPKSGYVFSRF